jgi:nucleoside-diphosphate-sugar epimerase
MQLVTGATGIVGSHVLLACAERGPVRALHRPGGDHRIVDRIFRHYHADADELLARIEWVGTDILDVEGLHAAMQQVTTVYHTAALVSFVPGDARAMHRVNVTGTANVVNTALEHGVERMCHVSSTAAIGSEPAGIARTERSPWTRTAHTSTYALSKYAAELEVYRGIAEGLEAVMVNPCVVLGPGLAGRSSMALVERLRRGTAFYPPGTNAVVDARDVAACMIALTGKGTVGERYLLVGEHISYERLFALLATAFGEQPPTRRLRPWMLEAGWRIEALRSFLTRSRPFITRATAKSAIAERTYSASKVEDTLGYRFRSAQDAVENIAAFLADRPAWMK